MALSAFSDLTLAEISVISVFCLPVWSADLSNPADYRFGREGLTATMHELAERYPDIEFSDMNLDDEIDSVYGYGKEEAAESGPATLFFAVSLFQFRLNSAKELHGSFSWLEYTPGEVGCLV
jgi:hypothetical protein